MAEGSSERAVERRWNSGEEERRVRAEALVGLVRPFFERREKYSWKRSRRERTAV